MKKTLEIAILAATGLAVLGFAVMMLFPAQVIRLFSGEDKALLAMGTHAIRLSILMLPLVGFQIVSRQLLSSGRQTEDSHALDAVAASAAPDPGGVDSAALFRPRRRLGRLANFGFCGFTADRHLLAAGIAAIEGESFASTTACGGRSGALAP